MLFRNFFFFFCYKNTEKVLLHELVILKLFINCLKQYLSCSYTVYIPLIVFVLCEVFFLGVGGFVRFLHYIYNLYTDKM